MKLLKHPWSLSVAGGFLLAISWPEIGRLSFFIFIAFIPFLLLEKHYFDHQLKAKGLFLKAYAAFFLFNLLTTWWIAYASVMGACIAIFINPIFMASIVWIFHQTKKWINPKVAYIAFPFYWIGFEYLHYNWVFSWPWLTIGNMFANTPSFIQWYEYTGVLGGTLWVLIINLLLFGWLFEGKRKMIVPLIAFLLIPAAISLGMYYAYSESKEFREIVVIQPNIDPYNEKFGSSDEQQLDKILRLANLKLTDSTAYLIAPETALPRGYWENDIQEEPEIQLLQQVVQQHPNLKIIAGLSSYRAYINEEPTETARAFRDGGGYYDAYNTSMQLSKDTLQLYHKSKLVLGVETMPFRSVLGPLEEFFDFGGTSGTLGAEKEAKVFISQDTLCGIICYESVYGEYLTDFINKGASMIVIITNDGWWENTPGHRQHLAYARLRAIETRRSIARSANTGISAFINGRGDVLQRTNWWEEAVIREKLSLNNETTFYAQNGDYLGRITAFFSVLLLSWCLRNKFMTLK